MSLNLLKIKEKFEIFKQEKSEMLFHLEDNAWNVEFGHTRPPLKKHIKLFMFKQKHDRRF